MIRIKEGVSLDRLNGKMFFAISMADRVWEQLRSSECHIAGTEPAYIVEFDARCFDDSDKKEARRLLKAILGRNYEVGLRDIDECISVRFDGPY